MKTKEYILIGLLTAFLPVLLPLSGEGQTISRNKKKTATTSTAKKQSGQSSRSSGTATKNLPAPIQQLISDMVSVKGGTFTMGATPEQGNDALDEEFPPHRVKVSSFSICKYEVTQAQWKAVMGNNPSHFKGDNLPVEQVSWEDCQTFIRKLNKLTGRKFRLPTEEEWEFAARGGNLSRSSKFSGSNHLSNVAWYKENSGSKTHSVGSKSPNELGLYDMCGNVSEWCQNLFYDYKSSYKSEAGSPYRINRGGSWYDTPFFCRLSLRRLGHKAARTHDFGLRLAM